MAFRGNHIAAGHVRSMTDEQRAHLLCTAMESLPDGDPLKVRIGLVLQKIKHRANHPIPEGISGPELGEAIAKDAALESEIEETADEPWILNSVVVRK